MDATYGRNILAGRSYEELPPRVRSAFSKAEYNSKVKQYFISCQSPWSDETLLKKVISEQEYYTELVSTLKEEQQMYPYHLSDYVNRVQRVSPFKYYSEILLNALKAERPFDSIPNFTAADVVAVTGIGRNEFIDILNKCRGKRLMWKVNKALAKDFLPSEPLRPAALQPWWIAEAVNVNMEDVKKMSDNEHEVMKRIGKEQSQRVRVASLDQEAVVSLYLRGLVYLDVPITSADKISIPPMENFVSNKSTQDSETVEGMLYRIFVASSERASVGELASVLEADLVKVLRAVSLACRLGFAQKVQALPGRRGSLGLGLSSNVDGIDALSPTRSSRAGIQGPADESIEEGDEDGDEESENSPPQRAFAALLVDTTLTSFLMMGNLSAGLKRHAVTLFEGGRLADANVSDFLKELRSVESDERGSFEGTVNEIVEHVQALGIILESLWPLRQSEREEEDSLFSPLSPDTGNSSRNNGEKNNVAPPISVPNLIDFDDVKETEEPSTKLIPNSLGASQNSQKFASIAVGGIDVLRIESVTSLSREVCRKVLLRDYSLLLLSTHLRAQPLPALPLDGVTSVMGPTGSELVMPWMKIVLYSCSRNGPNTIIIPAGTRLAILPEILSQSETVALWPWTCESGPSDAQIVRRSSLLMALNDLLCKSAILAQALPAEATREDSRGKIALVKATIPFPPVYDESGYILGVADENFEDIRFSPEELSSCGIADVIDKLGLKRTVGLLEVIRLKSCPNDWAPLDLQLGVPLFSTKLCRMVCKSAARCGIWAAEGVSQHNETMLHLRSTVRNLVQKYALRFTDGPVDSGGGEHWEEGWEFEQPSQGLLLCDGDVCETSMSLYSQGGISLSDIL